MSKIIVEIRQLNEIKFNVKNFVVGMFSGKFKNVKLSDSPKGKKVNKALTQIIDATVELEKLFNENPELEAQIEKKLGLK